MSLINIINELVVENIEKTLEFYETIFKFKIVMTDGEPITWAKLKKDELIIMLEKYDTVKESISKYPQKSNTSNLIKFEYSDIQEFKDLYNFTKQNNIEFFMEYTETNYGKVEFGIFDLDRNMILISAEI